MVGSVEYIEGKFMDEFGKKIPVSALRDDSTYAPVGSITPGMIGAVATTGGGLEKIVIETSVTGTYTPDVSLGNIFVLNLAGDTQINVPLNNGAAIADLNAAAIMLIVVQKVGSGGSKKLTYATGITPFSGVTPALQTTEGKSDILTLLMLGDHTTWTILDHTSTLAIPSFIDILPSAEPPNPASGVVRIWLDATLQTLIRKDSAGVKTQLGTSAPASSGVITAVSGQFTSKLTAAAAGSFSIALPATPTTGHDIVVALGTDASAITAPAGWTVDYQPTSTAEGTVGFYRLRSTGIAGDKTAAFTFSGTHYVFATITEYAGVVSPSPVDQTATARSTGSGGTSITTSATATASELTLCVCRTGGLYSAGALGWSSSGFGTLYDSGGGGVGSKALSATGAVTATPTVGGTISMTAAVITYKAA